MTIASLITTIDAYDDGLTVYVKRQDNKISESSEAVLLALTDDEHDMDIEDIAEQKCPGFEYFMELSMIKDMVAELRGNADYTTPAKILERLIYFQEYDA